MAASRTPTNTKAAIPRPSEVSACLRGKKKREEKHSVPYYQLAFKYLMENLKKMMD
jgi:hypothetical protein